MPAIVILRNLEMDSRGYWRSIMFPVGYVFAVRPGTNAPLALRPEVAANLDTYNWQARLRADDS